jgi:hypothetical protein
MYALSERNHTYYGNSNECHENTAYQRNYADVAVQCQAAFGKASGSIRDLASNDFSHSASSI